MSLKKYKEKRNFQQTPEPADTTLPLPEVLEFVVQRHEAHALHYDFRLLMDGVLKSWAVPKGPSLNPEDKRLAVQVEDHPYDYIHFEGEIEPGNYGAGHVDIWDSGNYMPLKSESEPADEQYILKQWQEGSIKFFLNGDRLKGSFALVRIHSSEDNTWLLIKHKDEYAVHGHYNAEDYPHKQGK